VCVTEQFNLLLAHMTLCLSLKSVHSSNDTNVLIKTFRSGDTAPKGVNLLIIVGAHGSEEPKPIMGVWGFALQGRTPNQGGGKAP